MNPDNVMLRRPNAPRRAPDARPAPSPVPTPAPASARAPAPVPERKVIVETNRVTDVVVQTNIVKDIVVETNRVTDVVFQTNVVTDVVFQTNVVTDVVVQTNVVTDVVFQTNVVTDVVVQTNIVTETRLDTREKDALIAARAAAERQARDEQAARAKAEAEIARVKAELAIAEAARREAEARFQTAATQAAAAEKKAAAAETARSEVAAQVDHVAQRALDERKARERAEAEMRAAERRAENERAAALAVARQLEAITNAPPVVETPDYMPDQVVPAAASAPSVAGKAAPGAPKKGLTGRDAVITAERMDYDRKEGVILFDRNVYVDDEQYQMHADRLFVFLETNNVARAKSAAGKDGKDKPKGGGIAGMGSGTTLKRLVAIGHVSITNEQRSAACARATYARRTGKIVMYGNDEITPWILDPQQSQTPQYGEKITFWTISQQVEIEKPVLSGAALGKGKGGNPLDALKK